MDSKCIETFFMRFEADYEFKILFRNSFHNIFKVILNLTKILPLVRLSSDLQVQLNATLPATGECDCEIVMLTSVPIKSYSVGLSCCRTVTTESAFLEKLGIGVLIISFILSNQ